MDYSLCTPVQKTGLLSSQKAIAYVKMAVKLLPSFISLLSQQWVFQAGLIWANKERKKENKKTAEHYLVFTRPQCKAVILHLNPVTKCWEALD